MSCNLRNECLLCQQVLVVDPMKGEEIMWLQPARAHVNSRTPEHAWHIKGLGPKKLRGGVHTACWNQLVSPTAPHLIKP